MQNFSEKPLDKSNDTALCIALSKMISSILSKGVLKGAANIAVVIPKSKPPCGWPMFSGPLMPDTEIGFRDKEGATKEMIKNN